jgi:hypothetical protein
MLNVLVSLPIRIYMAVDIGLRGAVLLTPKVRTLHPASRPATSAAVTAAPDLCPCPVPPISAAVKRRAIP